MTDANTNMNANDTRPTTNITPENKREFEALTSGEYGNFALYSCFVNGEPTVAIVVVDEKCGRKYTLTPLYVALTDGMVLTDHDGNEAGR